MKVAFLDVDGVLNNREAFRAQKGNGTKVLDKSQVKMVSDIVRETGAKVVISSMWRKRTEDHMVYLRKAFVEVGVEIHDVTPVIISKPRFREIERWLGHNGADRFVVVDDDLDAEGSFGRAFFRTNTYIGLTEEIKNEIISYLNETER